MGNRVHIFKRGGNITKADVISIFNRVNEERFNGLLHYKTYKNGGDMITILPMLSGRGGLTIDISNAFTEYSEDKDGYTDEEIVSGTHIDMLHGHSNDFYWWLDEIFIIEFTKRLNTEIYDEGIGVQTLDNYKDLSFQDWLRHEYKHVKDDETFDIITGALEGLEDSLGSEFYHTFITETIPRRNDKIDSILKD